MLGHRIWGKRLGIIGMGRIGQAVARAGGRLWPPRSTTTTANRLDEETEAELDATWWQSLDQMLAHMDFVSIHCPSTPATYHLLSARRLGLLRPQAYVINTSSRGHAIDEAALVRLLDAGRIAGRRGSTSTRTSRWSRPSCSPSTT